MSIGHRIIESTIRGQLVSVECPALPDAPCLIVWSSGAAEQLEALVAEHVAKLVRENHALREEVAAWRRADTLARKKT